MPKRSHHGFVPFDEVEGECHTADLEVVEAGLNKVDILVKIALTPHPKHIKGNATLAACLDITQIRAISSSNYGKRSRI